MPASVVYSSLMTEPDVALTDYFLTAECVVFSSLLSRLRIASAKAALKKRCVLFFIALGLASLFGGTVHGFFLDDTSLGHYILWRLTLITIGLVAFLSWMIGAELVIGDRGQQLIHKVAAFGLFFYSAYVIFGDQSFLIAVVNYLPAAMFLLVSLFLYSQKVKKNCGLWGVLGLLISFVATVLQQLEVGIHPVFFNHNALYHLLQAIALGFLFVAFRALMMERAIEEAPRGGRCSDGS